MMGQPGRDKGVRRRLAKRVSRYSRLLAEPLELRRLLSSNAAIGDSPDWPIYEARDVNYDARINGIDLTQLVTAGTSGTGEKAAWQEADLEGAGSSDSQDVRLLDSSASNGAAPYVASGCTSAESDNVASSSEVPRAALSQGEIHFVPTGNMDSPLAAFSAATYSLVSLAAIGQTASYELWLDFVPTGSEPMVYFSVDVSASDDVLTGGSGESEDYSAFSFVKASPLLDGWQQIGQTDFGPGPLNAAVELQTGLVVPRLRDLSSGNPAGGPGRRAS